MCHDQFGHFVAQEQEVGQSPYVILNSQRSRPQPSLPSFQESFGHIKHIASCQAEGLTSTISTFDLARATPPASPIIKREITYKHDSRPELPDPGSHDLSKLPSTAGATQLHHKSLSFEHLDDMHGLLSNYVDRLERALMESQGVKSLKDISSSALVKLYISRNKDSLVYEVNQNTSRNRRSRHPALNPHHAAAERKRRSRHQEFDKAKDSMSGDFVMDLSDQYLQEVATNGRDRDSQLHTDGHRTTCNQVTTRARPRRYSARVAPGKYQVHMRGIFGGLLGRLTVQSLTRDLDQTKTRNAMLQARISEHESIGPQ